MMKQDQIEYPFVSIVVPIYNAESTIDFCVQSLLNQQYPAEYEIILVDNNSKDKTSQILDKYQDRRIVRLEENACQSSYAARNKGIQHAQGEIVAFTDADCLADSQWLAKLVSSFQSQNVGGVAGIVRALDPKTAIEKYQEWKGFFTQDELAKGPFGAFPVAANAAYRRDLILKAGLFNQKLISGGDCEFGKRVMRKTEYEIVRSDDAIIFHKYCDDLRSLYQQRYRYGFGCFQLISLGENFSPFLRIKNPYIYGIVGFIYFGFKSLVWLVKFPFRKTTLFKFHAMWIDYFSEFAFRRGYKNSFSLKNNLTEPRHV